MSAASRLERWVLRVARRDRWRRALAGGLLGLAAASAAGSVVLVVASTGRLGAWPWSWTAAGAAAALPLLTALVGLSRPRSRNELLRDVDRRMGLRGALVTAGEFVRDADPVCRLLVERTARRLEGVAPREALAIRPGPPALVLPGLLALTVGLQVATRPAMPGSRTVAPAPAPADVELSVALQERAARILRGERDRDRALDAARALLELEAALREGRLSRAEVLERLASRGITLGGAAGAPAEVPRAGRPGEASAGAGERDRAADAGEEMPRLTPSSRGATGPGGSPGGAGRGAGSGRAGLELEPAESGLGAEGEDRWILPGRPVAGRGSRAGVGPFDDDDGAVTPPELARPVRGPQETLTDEESRTVRRYLERLSSPATPAGDEVPRDG